jgi:hypothetical protein
MITVCVHILMMCDLAFAKYRGFFTAKTARPDISRGGKLPF